MTTPEDVLAYADELGRFPTQREAREHLKGSSVITTAAWREARTIYGAELAEKRRNVVQSTPHVGNTTGIAGSVKRYVILSDLHIPFDDVPLVQKILAWIETQFLHGVILNGDVLDFKVISKFAEARNYPLEDEITRGNVFLDQLQEAARKRNPACQIDWTDGNHEDRLVKYMNRNAAELIGLTDEAGDGVVSIPHLMRLRARSIRYHDYRQVIRLPGNLWIEHGDRVSKHSGYTAKNIVTDKGGSVMIGHVHRIGAHYKKDRMGFHRGFEIGCLCDTNPSWITADSTNWQQGFMIVDFHREDKFWAQQVVVQEGSFVIDGRVWS